MRSRSAMLALAAFVGLAAFSLQAWARPNSTFTLALWPVGEPSTVGVITSAGASTTNASTAVPFVISTANVPQRVITLQADATAFCGFSATCGTTFATANGCFRLSATDPPKVVVLGDATTSMNCAGGAAFNVVVTKLQ